MKKLIASFVALFPLVVMAAADVIVEPEPGKSASSLPVVLIIAAVVVIVGVIAAVLLKKRGK